MNLAEQSADLVYLLREMSNQRTAIHLDDLVSAADHIERLQATIAKVRAMHDRPDGEILCMACGDHKPCATARLVAGEGGDHPSAIHTEESISDYWGNWDYESDRLDRCEVCGAVVSDIKKHVAWHNDLSR